MLGSSPEQDGRVDCVFCSIIEGLTPAWAVYEDDVAVAFLDSGPATPGHTLVVSRTHAPDIWSLSEDAAASVMRSVHRVATLLRATLQPVGMNVIQSSGSAAWQEVLHYHVHLVPRYGTDDLIRPWRSTATSPDELSDVHRRIRQH